MKHLSSEGLRTTAGFIEVLDQRLLPDEEVWRPIRDVPTMITAIQDLSVRGAPLIGVAAALALAQSAQGGTSETTLREECEALHEARPTAVNLMNAMERMRTVFHRGFSMEALVKEALEIFEEDARQCECMAEHGQKIITPGDQILTHCNTGGLATVGRGTAFSILRLAHERGQKIHVLIDETRPLLQGARLTAWECARHDIPATLISDNMAAWQMAQGRVSKVIVGADRIATNGDFANKIGTYNLAVLCHYHRIPFYVAAPHTTVDLQCNNGGDIPIEQRHGDEVRGARGAFGEIRWAPEKTPVDNPAFDVTPATLVDGWILDTGLYNREQVRGGALQRPLTEGH